MGTRPIIYKYPLDLTGRQPNNLVLGEPQSLPNGINRAIVPNYGAFYAESLVIRDAVSGAILVPREQFKAVQLYQEATERTGLEVCAVVVVTDSSVSALIEIDYQAIGGEFSYSVANLRDMLENLDLDARPVIWGDLIGRPGQFPPAPHLHDAGDLYGFEYLVEGIDSLRYAIMVGQDSELGALRQYIELVDTRVEGLLQRCHDAEERIYVLENQAILTAHLSTTNPHAVSAFTLNLDTVINKAFLTTAEVNSASQVVFTDLANMDITLELEYSRHLTTRAHEETLSDFNLIDVMNGEYATVQYAVLHSQATINDLS